MTNTVAANEHFKEDANYRVDVGEYYPDEVLDKRWRWATDKEEAEFTALKDSDPWVYAKLAKRIQEACYGMLTEGLPEEQVRAPMGRNLKHLHGKEVVWVAEWKEPSQKGVSQLYRVYFMDVADFVDDGVTVPAPMVGLMFRKYPKSPELWKKVKKPKQNKDIERALKLAERYCREHGLTPRTTVL